MGTVTAAPLSVSDVTKAFAGNVAVDDVSLEVRPGELHGLVGGNGSGKSTLIKILAGVHRADAGRLQIGDRAVDAARVTPEWSWAAGLRFVHQDPGVVPALSVGENMALRAGGFPTVGRIGIRWRDLHRSAQAVLDRLEIPLSSRASAAELRPAERTMIAIARAFADGDLMPGRHAGRMVVLDEPTAALRPLEVEHLIAGLRRIVAAGEGVLYVSHRLPEIVELADRVTVLRDGGVAGELEGDEITEARLIELIVGRSLELRPKQATEVAAREDVVLEVRGVVCEPRVEGADLTLHRGEILGMAGLFGSGRTELLEVLFGARRRQAGEILLEGAPLRLGSVADAVAAGIAYVPADRAAHASFTGMGVRENLTAAAVPSRWRGLGIDHAGERALAAQLMGEYAIVADTASQPVATLSGGNQQKVMLARWLRRSPKVLLLDEPTQGVDVGARANIYAAIRRAVAGGMAVIVAGADSEELATLCDRVVVVDRGRMGAQLAAPGIDPDRLDQLVLSATAEERE